MLNFVHIGIGQCGNRFAEQFGKNGRIALAVNTARIDMSSINSKAINARNQIHIALPDSPDGAGRDPEIGRESMEANLEKVYDAIQKAIGDTHVDRIALWAGLGGGTGTGGIIPLMKYLMEKDLPLMLCLTIPRKKEGWLVRMNAFKALTDITDELKASKRHIVPFLVIDNDKFIGSISANNDLIARTLVRFTKTTNNVPTESAFDDRDFNRLLGYKGMLTVVRTSISTDSLKGGDSFVQSIQESWKKSLYAKFDPAEAAGAANLVIVPSKFYQTKGNDLLIDENIETLDGIYPHANPYSCIYESKNDDIDKIIIYTLLTGLPNPDENIDEMYDDISEQISEDKARRKERSRAERAARAKRHVLEYDPNDDFDDDDDDNTSEDNDESEDMNRPDSEHRRLL